MSSHTGNQLLALRPHPSAPPSAGVTIGVNVTRPESNQILFDYRLSGDLGALLLPGPALPQRTDGLWRHTCFEAFIGSPHGTAYQEFNFAPSGAWAAYQFTAYRDGMAPLAGTGPVLTIQRDDDELRLSAVVQLEGLAGGLRPELRLGLAAVVEDRAHGLSYWALEHPATKPDFHHADGFILRR